MLKVYAMDFIHPQAEDEWKRWRQGLNNAEEANPRICDGRHRILIAINKCPKLSTGLGCQESCIYHTWPDICGCKLEIRQDDVR